MLKKIIRFFLLMYFSSDTQSCVDAEAMRLSTLNRGSDCPQPSEIEQAKKNLRSSSWF